MKITNAEFITSAADKKQFIKTDKPVIAVCGKSNVGKSSFINMLANRKKLAKVSKDPGRTRLVNYFDFGSFILADLPGYGFARVSKTEKLKWARLLDDLFRKRGNSARVFACGYPPRPHRRRQADGGVSVLPPRAVYGSCDQGGQAFESAAG